MITEIFCEGKRLDINADISSLLTFAIDDVKDFASRQTTFSKTVVLPGTANNNAIFGNIFETGISNDYDPEVINIGYNFNASKSAQCYIFQDNLQTFKGTLRLIEIDKDHSNIEYEVALNGELTGLNVALSSGYLTDLDFSFYNIFYTVDNISASWNNIIGSGVYFPLIDYGTYSTNKHDWNVRTFRPALYVKEYIDKMFLSANFRYNCDLFNTQRFKSLVVPHNQKTLLSKVSRVATAGKATSDIVIQTQIGTTSGKIFFENIIAGGFSYYAGEFTYTQSTNLTINLTFKLDGTRVSTTPGTFTVSARKNGVIIASQTFSTPPVTMAWGWTDSINLTLATNDKIDFFIQYDGMGTEMIVTAGTLTNFTMDSSIPVLLPVDYNQLITINDSIPQNIRQVDFLKSIVQLFNLYVYESPFDERLINISPFVDFYSASSGNTIDWTYKLNRDKPIKIKPLSEINSKIYRFKFRSDSDYFNALYEKRYNQGYGSYIFDSEFEFASQTNELELIFAPTPLVGYVAEEKVYPTIFKRTGPDTAPVEENVDSVIRILQTKKVMGIPTWNITNGGIAIGSYLSYGYAGHFDDPDNPGNDLNFGALNELFFLLATGDLTKTQFNLYWSSYMAEITDKDSKMLIAYFYLTADDIFRLDFSKYIVIDGVLFRLNKITDYNASEPGDCEVELLRVINTSYSFPPDIPNPNPETYDILWDVGQYLLQNDTDKIMYQ